jgi:hypothetical protein
VGAALVLPTVLDDGTPSKAKDPAPAAPIAFSQATWAVGSVIHVGDDTVDVGHTVRAYVTTDAGAVFSDPDGKVWSVDGTRVDYAGTINASVPHLVADGSRAGWVQPGPVPTFVVYDVATHTSVLSSTLTTSEMSDVKDGRDPAVLYALDGDTANVRGADGAVAWNTQTSDVQVLDPDANGFSIIDVKGGRFLFQPGTGEEGILVGQSLQEGTDFSLWSADSLSPGGRYLFGEQDPDDVRVFDADSGEKMPQHAGGYAYVMGYDWVDEDHYAAVGLAKATSDSQADILTCAVTTGDCIVVGEHVGTLPDGLVVPTGESLD